MERAAAIEATSAPPNKQTLTGGTKRIQKIECIGVAISSVAICGKMGIMP